MSGSGYQSFWEIWLRPQKSNTKLKKSHLSSDEKKLEPLGGTRGTDEPVARFSS